MSGNPSTSPSSGMSDRAAVAILAFFAFGFLAVVAAFSDGGALGVLQVVSGIVAALAAIVALRDSKATAFTLKETQRLTKASAEAEAAGAAHLAEAARDLRQIASDTRRGIYGPIISRGLRIAELLTEGTFLGDLAPTVGIYVQTETRCVAEALWEAQMLEHEGRQLGPFFQHPVATVVAKVRHMLEMLQETGARGVDAPLPEGLSALIEADVAAVLAALESLVGESARGDILGDARVWLEAYRKSEAQRRG